MKQQIQSTQIWRRDAKEVDFYRAMHYSAKRRIEIACRLLSVRPSVRLSLCDVGGSGSHKLEILETNCTDNKSPKAIRLLPGELPSQVNLGKFWGD